MPYRIAAETTDELLLLPVPVKTGCVRGLFSGFGLLAVLIGGGLLFARRGGTLDADTLIAGTLAYVGLGFLLLGIFLSVKQRPALAALVFDRRLGAVRVRAREGEPAEVCLAYADIADLRVHTHAETHSSSNSTYTWTSYTYHVVMQFHDGGRWYLTRENTPELAEAQLRQLVAAVAAAELGVAALPPPQLPPQVEHSTQAGLTTIRWRNELAGRQVLSWLVVLVFFGGALGLFFLVARPMMVPAAFAYAVLAFIALVFLVIMGSQARRMWLDYHRRYGLVFSPTAVAYVEAAHATDQLIEHQVIPLAEWYGLSCSLNDMEAGEEAVLLLTRAAHAQYLHQQKAELSLKEIVDFLTTRNQARRLYFSRFTPAQRLAVVNWVRAEVQRQRACAA
ncbi:hypothetical protein [Hymenobacter guriensis]|uniref:DUF2207 domain-containing protein n=1 Tax=Hymenobacter guriensis TaxID=2793065 RepID=A0ABS0L7X5_9BACT|nr:hypothetical protein [Hymenobacter guriensis]MBG8556255.1 hypothetical protein [Hymenobacter guriensis]